MQSYKICPNCGTTNLNQDYCKECGAVISATLQRKLEYEVMLAKKRIKDQNSEPNAITTAFEKAKSHRNPFIRLLATAFYSVWVLVLVVGGILALVFAYFAA